MQRRTLPCPAGLLSAEHDRQATERWRRSFRFRGNGGGPIRQAQRAIAGSSAGAAYGNPGGQLAVRRQPYKSRDQPVDRDDDHGPCGRSSPPLPTTLPDAHMPVARADQTAIVKPSRLGLDHSQRRPTRDEMVDVAPPRHRRRSEGSSACRPGSLRTPRTAFSNPAQSGDGSKPRVLFPESNHGRSRTRTWDLFLISKTFCPLQSSQLQLNPCEQEQQRAQKTTGGDWALRPDDPMVAQDRSSRARRRVARRRTSCGRYGQARARRTRAAAPA
jgi:hypothetical protein